MKMSNCWAVWSVLLGSTWGLTPTPLRAQQPAARLRVRVESEGRPLRDAEDVGEKTIARPGDITRLLSEMGGVRIQPGPGGLGGASIRLQGLPGEYTLLLTDGLPLHGAQAPVFSLAQVPPLDLAQVEVTKGAATALYGPSAPGGVVLLTTRRPARARDVLLSQTTRGASDGRLWLSDSLSSGWGCTVLGGAHRQVRTDVNSDGWADLPGYTRGEVRPRLFWRGANGSSLLLTAGGSGENRSGGTVPDGTVASFPETLRTRHGDVGANGHFLLGGAVLGVRASAAQTGFARRFGALPEDDRQRTLFAETTLSGTRGRHTPVAGLSAQHDALGVQPDVGVDFGFTTLSLFGQDTYAATDRLAVTYSHARATEFSLEEGQRVTLPLTPRSAGGVDVAWEEDDPGEAGFRVALEAFYTGRQRVEEDPYRTFAPGYTTVELLASKQLGRALLFGNVENLTDVRQTRRDPLLRPSPGLGGSWTTDEWAPIEGRVLNLGARVSF